MFYNQKIKDDPRGTLYESIRIGRLDGRDWKKETLRIFDLRGSGKNILATLQLFQNKN